MTVLVPKDAEAVFWAMVRAGASSGDRIQQVRAEAVYARLRPPPPSPAPLPGQLALWVRDAAGLPTRPWAVRANDRFDCQKLGCPGLLVSVCVARQLTNDAQRTEDVERGQAPDFPNCVSSTCAQGHGLREALVPFEVVKERSRGPRKGEKGFGLRRRLRADLASGPSPVEGSGS